MTRWTARFPPGLGLAVGVSVVVLSAPSAQAEILLNNGPAAGRVKVVSYRDLPAKCDT